MDNPNCQTSLWSSLATLEFCHAIIKINMNAYHLIFAVQPEGKGQSWVQAEYELMYID